MENDEDGFYSRLGLAIIDEGVLNVEYKFIYTSDGGIAQRSFTVPMNEENIIELINQLENKLSLKAQTKEQRALMTAKLRTFIKERDNYTCRQCGNSTFKEPNLLLEVDHIIPIIKGGLTKEDNLQTLCWKCNRSKGSKILNSQYIEMPHENSVNKENELYSEENELYRYYCVDCKKQFKVKGVGKKPKCPKCSHILYDMGVSDSKYERMNKEERKSIINNIRE